MKQLYFFALIFVGCTVTSQNIVIPDANFKSALINTDCADFNDDGIADEDADTNNDGEIQQSEALAVFSLFTGTTPGPPPFRVSGIVDSESPAANNIADLTGIEAFSNLKRLNVASNLLTTLDVSMLTLLTTLRCGSNDLTSLTLGTLANLVFLDCSENNLVSVDVSGVSALVTLKCGFNGLSSLDLGNLATLKTLDCTHNVIASLDLSMLSALQSLRCAYNSLSVLNVSNLQNLADLDCSANSLAALDVSALTQLTGLSCYTNNLTTLDVQNLTHLNGMIVSGNPLTIIVFGNNTALQSVYLQETLLQTIDLSDTSALIVHAENNPELTMVSVKNGVNSPEISGQFPAPPVVSFSFTNTPSLQFICGDDAEIPAILYGLNGQNVTVTSYCSFAPGGNYNTIAGSVRFDCSGENQSIPQIKVQANDGTSSGFTYTGSNGSYTVYAGIQNIVVSPLLENPGYFTVTPENYSFSFDSGGNTVPADFCLTPNGDHPDLEISLLPLTPARPGFDATYKIVYRNKGTMAQSGSVVMTGIFDGVTHFVSAQPPISAQTDTTLTWAFSNLLPFEARSITLTLHINSPIDTPPVSNGDLLDFSAVVQSTLADETTSDNTANLVQTVVGSFDPNDKAVSEGQAIDITQIDRNLHYVIRFQNTGTAAAEQVVIRDMLSDLLDASTVQIVSASHSCRTRLTDGNRLEFFFENINLPDATTDEPASHGYVAFAVKPNSSLAVGNVIENTANIYFDFNMPITTNTVATTVEQMLGVAGQEINAAKLYPNPAKNNFGIQLKEGIVTRVSIFNQLGQLVKTADHFGSDFPSVDISELQSGTYLVKIATDESTYTKKLIKL
jgi:uncharacterized repeat protein (TIGR01451 family)